MQAEFPEASLTCFSSDPPAKFTALRVGSPSLLSEKGRGDLRESRSKNAATLTPFDHESILRFGRQLLLKIGYELRTRAISRLLQSSLHSGSVHLHFCRRKTGETSGKADQRIFDPINGIDAGERNLQTLQLSTHFQFLPLDRPFLKIQTLIGKLAFFMFQKFYG